MSEAKSTLNSIVLEIQDLVEELRFDYQHTGNSSINPSAFSKTNDTGDWIMCCCPNHTENHASFGISKEPPYHTNCFYCGYIGTIDMAIEIAFGLDTGEGLAYLLSNYIFEETRTPLDIDGIIQDGRERHDIPCLGEEELIKFDETPKTNWDYKVGMAYLLNNRGLSQQCIDSYELRIDIQNNCIVFPQRTRNSELRFLQKRKIGSSYQGAKFINEGSPIKKDILFGLHHIERLKTTENRIDRVRLVESPIDVMSNYDVGIPAVAQNGKILFWNQIRELQLAGVKVIDLLYDNDTAGKKATKESTEKLIKAGFIVNHVRYPYAVKKDPEQDSNTLLKLGLLDKCVVNNVSHFSGLV